MKSISVEKSFVIVRILSRRGLFNPSLSSSVLLVLFLEIRMGILLRLNNGNRTLLMNIIIYSFNWIIFIPNEITSIRCMNSGWQSFAWKLVVDVYIDWFWWKWDNTWKSFSLFYSSCWALLALLYFGNIAEKKLRIGREIISINIRKISPPLVHRKTFFLGVFFVCLLLFFSLHFLLVLLHTK